MHIHITEFLWNRNISKIVSFFRYYGIYKILYLLKIIYFNIIMETVILAKSDESILCYIKISHDYAVMDLPRLSETGEMYCSMQV